MLSLIIGIGGNLYLAWLFGIALLAPAEHAGFIAQTGLLILVFESLSVHASMALVSYMEATTVRRRIKPAATLILYLGFAALYGFAFSNWLAAVVFIFSTMVKFFTVRDLDSVLVPVIISAATIAVTLFITGIFAKVLASAFPFPAELIRYGHGEYAQYPQALLAWGVLYYVCQAGIEIFLFKFFPGSGATVRTEKKS